MSNKWRKQPRGIKIMESLVMWGVVVLMFLALQDIILLGILNILDLVEKIIFK